MFCGNCGVKIEEGAKFCMGCGTPVGVQQSTQVSGQGQYQQPAVQPQQYQQYQQSVNPTQLPDISSFGYAFLCFLLGVFGFIIWNHMKKTNRPLKAKSCWNGALTGTIVGAILWIIDIAMNLS